MNKIFLYALAALLVSGAAQAAVVSSSLSVSVRVVGPSTRPSHTAIPTSLPKPKMSAPRPAAYAPPQGAFGTTPETEPQQ